MTKLLLPSKQQIKRGADSGELEHLARDAESLRVSTSKRCIVLRMVSGVELAVPIDSIEELANIPMAKLKTLRLVPHGEAIELPREDIHISVGGLIRDIFGMNWMRRGGRVRSEKKAAAARKNGAKGGRPRRKRTLVTA